MTIRPWLGYTGVLVCSAVLVALLMPFLKPAPVSYSDPAADALTRKALFAEIQPVPLSNCTFERLGEPHDGGYLVCGNLLAGVQSGYSYGINGYDGWGCDVSKRLHVKMHQYDCFETTAPSCPGGDPAFHAECIGPTLLNNGRLFDTLDNQIVKNGDAGKHIVMKIDVEGAEWDTFLTAAPSVLDHIDQLVVEFHGTEDIRFLAAMRRLKEHFYVAHVHHNNYACDPALAPFPSRAYELLLVNKALGVVDPSGKAMALSPLDAVNTTDGPDCQGVPPQGAR